MPVALVTGGEGGIGRAIVRRLVRAGFRAVSADVVVTAEQHGRPDPGESRVVRVTMDVGSTESVGAALASVAELGPIHALVNCAGILRTFAPTGFDDAAARLMFETNLLGAARVISAALPAMVDGGAIVNISSIAPRLSDQSETALYAASKAGLEAYTRHTAHGLAPRRIRVNAVAPGIIDVDMTAAMRRVAYSETSPLRSCPAGRMGTAEEVAESVEFLVSARAGYVNGTTLLVDGGIAGS